MKTKIAVLVTGATVALVLILHYLTLSRAGLPVGWMLYIGLPVTVSGELFALLLANVGAGWDSRPTRSRNHARGGSADDCVTISRRRP